MHSLPIFAAVAGDMVVKEFAYKQDRTVMRVCNREVTVRVTIREHEVNDIGSAAYINTDLKWVHKITSFGNKI